MARQIPQLFNIFFNFTVYFKGSKFPLKIVSLISSLVTTNGTSLVLIKRAGILDYQSNYTCGQII